MMVYSTRSNAVRAAREACKKVLQAPGYQAFEGHDYIIHPAAMSECEHLPLVRQIYAGTYRGPSKFQLRGPASEVA